MSTWSSYISINVWSNHATQFWSHKTCHQESVLHKLWFQWLFAYTKLTITRCSLQIKKHTDKFCIRGHRYYSCSTLNYTFKKWRNQLIKLTCQPNHTLHSSSPQVPWAKVYLCLLCCQKLAENTEDPLVSILRSTPMIIKWYNTKCYNSPFKDSKNSIQMWRGKP